MAYFRNKVIRKVIDKYKDIWALHCCESLMEWDLETYMPKLGYRYRGIALGRVSTISQNMFLSKEFKELFKKAKREKDLNEIEKGVLRVLERDFHYYESVPPSFLKEFAKARTKASNDWKIAKRNNDFKKFLPSLRKIVELAKKESEYLGYDKYPYDALLDKYEEGLTTKDVEFLFSGLQKRLPKLVEKIIKNSEFSGDHVLERYKYDKERMKKLSIDLLKKIGFPFSRGRLDVSAHPFTIDVNIDDVRITTWYPERNFRESLLATIHEFGHALYELQIDKKISMSPVGGGVSLGIHESQSRFWENIVARSREFIENNIGLFRKHLDFLNNFDENDIYRYFNTVKRSLIRVKADEVTYNLHILVRFEIEKEMINKDIDLRELPSLWNEKMERYLGVIPKKDSEGVLQDIHWSQGSIGYFPTYMIGTLLSAQIRKKIDKEIKLYRKIRNGNYKAIREWLRNRIHRYGSIYAPKKLIRKVFREDLNPEYFINYIREKYLE